MSDKITCAFKCGAELPLDEMLEHHCPIAEARGHYGPPADKIIEDMLTAEEVRKVSSTGGEKGSKLERYDLIPPEPLRLLARLYGIGGRKYADRNWERGYDWSLSYAAMQRHANQFWAGEDIDAHLPECAPGCTDHTEAPHVIAVAWHAFALAQFMVDHPDFDNRRKGGA